MSILQISQILFPFITYPYLIRVLGKETYGVIAYANAVIAYLLVLINFGFNISEIKEISIHRDDINKVSNIVSSVLIIRILFFLLSTLVLIILISTIPHFNTYKWLYIAYMGILFNTAIDPSFYFQGIEKMKFTTTIVLISNTIFLVLVFVLVKNKSNYIFVPLFTSLGALTGSLIGLYFVLFKHKVKLTLQSIKDLRSHLKESLPFFSARVSVLLIDKTNIVLIGSFLGYTQVAYYDLAMKIISALKVPFGIVNQVLYPNVSKTKNVSLVIKALKILTIIYLFEYLFLCLGSGAIINLLAGPKLLPARFILYILGLTIISDLISTLMGAPMLLAIGYKNAYNKSIIISSAFYMAVISLLYLFHQIGIYQLSITTVCTSVFVLILRFKYCRTFKLI